ncbi:hypothetical protein Pmani_023953 [Petrolisthes manimaculis]|uniref:Uncharacterized protein n=1 Tax=Petrolisthes manimaculis TaxID=1843537 RepID=A0AAE1PB16_9EUCA|nr:hypothetical protein Pmani_023953 [Petrolisthes manimaculis]
MQVTLITVPLLMLPPVAYIDPFPSSSYLCSTLHKPFPLPTLCYLPTYRLAFIPCHHLPPCHVTPFLLVTLPSSLSYSLSPCYTFSFPCHTPFLLVTLLPPVTLPPCHTPFHPVILPLPPVTLLLPPVTLPFSQSLFLFSLSHLLFPLSHSLPCHMYPVSHVATFVVPGCLFWDRPRLTSTTLARIWRLSVERYLSPSEILR